MMATRTHPSLVQVLVLVLVLVLVAATAPAAAQSSSKIAASLSFSPTAQPVAQTPVDVSVSFKRRPAGKPIPTSTFAVSHTQLLHMVGLGADLDTFFHWHPTSAMPAALTAKSVVFPQAGRYVVGLDAALKDGTPVAEHTQVTVGGTPRMRPAAAASTTAGGSSQRATVTVRSTPMQKQQPAVSLSALTAVAKPGDKLYTATLSGPLGAACVPGKPADYTWTLVHAGSSGGRKGRPVTDLHEYLGAPMHLAVVSADLGHIAHEHGSVVRAGSSSSSVASERGTRNSNNNNDNNAQAAAAGAAAAEPAEDHADHTGRRLAQHEGHDNMSMMPAGGFGPALKTRITFPAHGSYVLVGQLARGDGELILLPLRVSCDV